ncbi:MAG: hypothetical protein R3B13_14455 [Polyangiaceae bacterium]
MITSSAEDIVNVLVLCTMSLLCIYLVVRYIVGKRQLEAEAELGIVLRFAVWTAHREGTCLVTIDHFLRAARRNPRVAARVGPDLTPLGPHQEEQTEVRFSPDFALALGQAKASARGRRASEYDLCDVFASLRVMPGTSAAKLLESLDLEELRLSLSEAKTASAKATGIYILNDDRSKMADVAKLFERQFNLDPAEAAYQMLRVHVLGYGFFAEPSGGTSMQLLEQARARAKELGLAELVITTERPDTRSWKRSATHGLLPDAEFGWTRSG